MVDPVNITNFNLDHPELEEVLLFCLCVFNKKACQIAPKLDAMLKHVHTEQDIEGWQPFAALEKLTQTQVKKLLMKFKISPYDVKSEGVYQLVNSGLDLKTCPPDDLISIRGISFKTSRYFVLHTREDANVACLDTHMLKWLKSLGYEGVPKSSPQNRAMYKKWEDLVLAIAKERNLHPAVLDLQVWNEYRSTS